MDKINLSGQTDFALTTDALAFMQSAYEALEKLGALGGDNYIVSGCSVSGSTATSGWMVLKGKLMPFQGGSIQTNVRIIEETNTVDVDVASRQQTTYRAEFGTSSDSSKNVAWDDIKRPPKIVDIFSKTESDSRFNRLKGKLEDTDLNSLNSESAVGIYYQRSNSDATLDKNYPVEEKSGVLEVFYTYDVVQRYTTYRTSSTNPRTFVRGYHPDDGWGDWVELATHKDVSTLNWEQLIDPGNTYLNNDMSNAYITKTLQGEIKMKGYITVTKVDPDAGMQAIMGLFKIPSEYSPSREVLISVKSFDGVSGSVITDAVSDTDDTFEMQGAEGTFYLDGISYFIS